MRKYVVLTLAALAALALDCAFFPAWSPDVCAWMCLALALAATAAIDVQTGIVLALVCGLVIDAICNSYLGLTAACYLVSVSALWLMIRKNRPKPVVLMLYAALAAALPTPIIWLYSYLAGAHFHGLWITLRSVLPSALLTGLLVPLFGRLLHWAKKTHRDRI